MASRAETAKLVAELGFVDKLSPGVGKALGSVGRLESGLGRLGKGAGQISAGFARAGTLIAGAAVTGLGLATKYSMDFEDAFQGVVKTVDASAGELEILRGQIRDMATEIPISASELAALGETAGALGIQASGIDEFIETTAKLGVTTNLTADMAADALGRIGNILGLTADQYDNFGSSLVNLGNKGASTEAEIIEITKRFAAQGKQAGLTTQEILGLAEATASFTGLNEEAAGTSLSRLTAQLTKLAANGGDKFKELNKVVGEDFRKALDRDASGALVKFFKGISKLDKYERASFLKEMGLDSAYLRQLIGGLTENVDGLESSFANAQQGWNGNFLNEEAAKKFDTLKQKLILFKQNVIEAGMTMADGFTPAIGRATDKLIAFLKVDANKAALKTLGEDIGKAIDSIDWNQVLSGAQTFVGLMKGALGYAKGLFDIVNMLPTEIKAAGLGLIGLNKLSGGLIGSGLGNLAGGIGETIARSAGSRLPGIGKLFAQPVFVTNWPLGGMGGAGGIGAGAAAAGGAGALATGAAVGAAAIAILGAYLVQQDQSNKNTALSQGIKEGLDSSIFSKSQAELQYALDGVNQGIADLQSNPLHVLVAGDALANLQAMKTSLEEQLKNPKNQLGGQSQQDNDPDKRQWRNDNADRLIEIGKEREANARREAAAARDAAAAIRDKVDDAGARQKEAIEATKARLASAAAETTRETSRGSQLMAATTRGVAPPIVSALHSMPTPITNVYVTASQVTKSITYQQRSGSGGGSASGGGGSATGGSIPV